VVINSKTENVVDRVMEITGNEVPGRSSTP